MEFRYVSLLISVVVGVILATTVLIPIVGDATATEKTFTNEGYFRMSESTEETVITWTPSVDAFKITVNGADISLDSLKTQGYSNYSIAFADDFILRYYYESAAVQNLQIWKSAYVVGIGSSSTNTATITINAEGITWSTTAEGSTPQSITHTGSYFIIDPEGDYSMKFRNEGAYIHTDSSLIYAGGLSLISGSTFTGIYFEGTSEDITVTPMSQTVNVSNIESHTTQVSGYVDLYTLDRVTFTTTYTTPDPAVDRDQTYSYFLVPHEVTAEKTQHMTSTELTLVGIIPLLVIVGLIVGVVAVVGRRAELF